MVLRFLLSPTGVGYMGYRRFDLVVGTGMPTRLFRGLKSPLRALKSRKNEVEHPYNGCSTCSENGRTCRDGLVVTDEHSYLTCVRWERIGCGRRCPLAWACHPLLTSTARTAIHVVHVGFGLPGAVVFFVRAGRDALCLVDGFHAIVTEVTLLNEFNGMRFNHA